MAFGKAKKQLINKARIVQPKLDKKMLSDEFYKELKERKCSKEEKFKLRVYNHEISNGVELTKKEWIEWLDSVRDNKVI